MTSNGTTNDVNAVPFVPLSRALPLAVPCRASSSAAVNRTKTARPPALDSFGVDRSASVVSIRSGGQTYGPRPPGGPHPLTIREFDERAVDAYGASFAGQPVQLTGFVARPQDGTGFRLALARSHAGQNCRALDPISSSDTGGPCQHASRLQVHLTRAPRRPCVNRSGIGLARRWCVGGAFRRAAGLGRLDGPRRGRGLLRRSSVFLCGDVGRLGGCGWERPIRAVPAPIASATGHSRTSNAASAARPPKYAACLGEGR